MLSLIRLCRLSFLAFPFITSVHSFQVIAPSQVTVGQPATVQWIRHNGDPSSFGVLLRRNSQDHGGTIVVAVRGTNDDKGSAQFIADQDTQYLVAIIRELEISSNQLPSTLASSSTIVAVKGSVSTVQGDPPANTNTNQPNTATSTPNDPPRNTSNPPNDPPRDTNNPPNDPPRDPSNPPSGSNTNNGDRSEGQKQDQPSSVTPTSTGAPNTQTNSGGRGDSSPLGTGNSQVTSDTSSSLTSRSTTTNNASTTGTSKPSPSPTSPTSPPSTPPAPSPKPNHTAAIVGSILGALILLLLLLILYLWYRRHQRKRQTQNFAFRRDLMVRPDQTQTTQTGTGVSFWSASISSPGGSDTDAASSFEYGAGFTLNPSRVVSWTPSGSTTLSSSPSVFYTAAPAGSTTLAPGFVFPVQKVTPAPALSSSSGSASGSTAGQTARQTAIKNKMSQLRTQLLLLQSRSARGSGDSESVASMHEKRQQDRDEVQRIREELERLGGILNSGWALKRLESGGDVPAGLKT